ncbi:MAG: hypothetical protein KGJ13_08290 [Patescibacteria group bacterium]|nr:hypothetical protein [Patescibacteria group bacterium]
MNFADKITDKRNIMLTGMFLVFSVVAFAAGRQSVLLPGKVVIEDGGSISVEHGQVVIGTPSDVPIGDNSPATIWVHPNTKGAYFSKIIIYSSHRMVDFEEK